MTASHQAARGVRDGRRSAVMGAALLLSAACGFPTEIPQVDQRWIVPPQTTTIAVATLLPAGVRILPDSSGFTVDLAPVSVTRALSADCAACAAANGTTVAKPAFVATASVSSPLPTDILAATLTAGVLQLSVLNNYNFDPLRPSATARGWAVITVTNGSAVIGRDSLNGADVALPPGATIVRNIPLAGTVSSASPVTISVTMNSPDGDAIQMDASRTIVVTATPGNLRVASASIAVANRQVGASSSLDLTNVDATIINHITGGSLLLDVANPFAVSGTVAVQFSAVGMTTISRSIALAPGTTHPSVTLSADELRALFGHQVTVSFSGPVSAVGGSVTVTPKQAVVVTSRLDVTLHTGG